MINEDYISYEIAKLLKEKGFNEKVDTLYKMDAEFLKSTLCINYNNHDFELSDMHHIPEKTISAPTLQMTMKWLRKVYHYYIQVMLDSWACGGHSGYYVMIQKTDSDFEMMLADVYDKVFYNNPEEAAEAAIKYILENLI